MRYGFLGPETTFTHQALLKALATSPGTELNQSAAPHLVPYASVAGAMGDLLAGDINALMAPIENSVEGGVSGTLDVLAATGGITIVAEEIVPISFVLVTKSPTTLAQIKSVKSHTHAQAQCQAFVRSNLPGALVEPALSTAAAAKEIAELSVTDPRAKTSAALCSKLAAEHYGLQIVAENVEDNPGAQTRFVLVARDSKIPARTGADKTTIVAYLAHNRAGSLLEMLEVMSANGVNLSRIESRPVGDALGRYSFSIDMEGHLEDRRIAAALSSLHRVCAKVVFLGSYARADASEPLIEAHNSDTAYDKAREFVAKLEQRISTN